MSRSRVEDYFCRLLVDARLQQKKTQQEVASALGKPQSFVSKYEGGERRLDVLEFLEICMVLGIKPGSIIEKLEAEIVREEINIRALVHHGRTANGSGGSES